MSVTVADRITKPSEERRQHGRVYRGGQTPDANGDIGDPFRADGLLDRMERRGDITAEMRQAGERFHALFHRAMLDPIRAADMLRTSHGNGPALNHGAERARNQVANVMTALGGPGSPAGSAVWIVVGCDYPVAQFAARLNWRGLCIDEKVAKGILIGALGTLVDLMGD
jgi:hypothetical protein